DYGHDLPVEWSSKKVNEYVGFGGYRSTINKVKDNGTIGLVFLDNEEDISTVPDPDIIPNNYILHGPPGTGKTHHVVDRAIKIIDADMYKELEADGRGGLQQYYSQLTNQGIIKSITFHQSYAYEDFIEGLKSDGNG